MKKQFLIILILIVTFSTSCIDSKRNVVYDLSNSSNLNISDTLFRYKDKMAIGISLKDSMAFIILAKSDTCISVLNINSKKLQKSFGLVGSGPGEINSPNFMPSIDISNEINLVDVNTKRMLTISKNKNNGYFLKELIQYPNEIFPSSNLNYSTNYIVGRFVGSENKKMFFIFDQRKHSKIEVETNPFIPDIKDVNYYGAPNLALNAQRKTIVAGMYFLDMFHLYDLQGNLKKTFCFSNNYIPKIDKKTRAFDLSDGAKGINKIFPTKNHCYLFRYTEKPVVKNGVVISSIKESFLVKIDWNGNLIKSFKIKDEIIGNFYIDEKNNKLFAIRHVIEPENNEFYDVVSYSLNDN